MNDKRVANKTILVKQVPIPKKIIYISKNILNIIGNVQKSKNNTRRTNSQTSNLINNLYDPSQSEIKLPNGNIQSSVFYGCSIDLILKMLNKSNTS